MIGKYTYRGRHRRNQPSRLKRVLVTAVAASAVSLTTTGLAHAAPDSVWDRLAQCESGGRWNINTGNGYYGGLQHSLRTWRAFGGEGMPHHASREEQIRVATRVQATQGWGAWPACSRKLGLRGTPPPAQVAPLREAPRERQTLRNDGGDGDYTVKAGDTLGSIAAAHGTSWQALYENNRDVVENPNVIYPGEKLDV